jgi:hypothetical protein
VVERHRSTNEPASGRQSQLSRHGPLMTGASLAPIGGIVGFVVGVFLAFLLPRLGVVLREPRLARSWQSRRLAPDRCILKIAVRSQPREETDGVHLQPRDHGRQTRRSAVVSDRRADVAARRHDPARPPAGRSASSESA